MQQDAKPVGYCPNSSCAPLITSRNAEAPGIYRCPSCTALWHDADLLPAHIKFEANPLANHTQRSTDDSILILPQRVARLLRLPDKCTFGEIIYFSLRPMIDTLVKVCIASNMIENLKDEIRHIRSDIGDDTLVDDQLSTEDIWEEMAATREELTTNGRRRNHSLPCSSMPDRISLRLGLKYVMAQLDAKADERSASSMLCGTIRRALNMAPRAPAQSFYASSVGFTLPLLCPDPVARLLGWSDEIVGHLYINSFEPAYCDVHRINLSAANIDKALAAVSQTINLAARSLNKAKLYDYVACSHGGTTYHVYHLDFVHMCGVVCEQIYDFYVSPPTENRPMEPSYNRIRHLGNYLFYHRSNQ